MQASGSAVIDPVTGRPPIPAMTSAAERECYYRLIMDGAARGAVVELGAWLGASTAYIAAAMRDSGTGRRAFVFDKFEEKARHTDKLKAFYGADAVPSMSNFDRYAANLGELTDHVETRKGQIEDIRWSGGEIAVLIADAPKRVPAISAVLTTFGDHLAIGATMAWQDFGHFPSYDIPACLYRIRDHIEFVEAVVPGTTMVFRVRSRWARRDVSRDALTPKRWKAAEIDAAWRYWSDLVPAVNRARFACGRALFLHDIGQVEKAEEALDRIVDTSAAEIASKWRYLLEVRPDLVRRYQSLFDILVTRGAL